MRNNPKNAYFIGIPEHFSDLISYDILRTWEIREPGGLPSEYEPIRFTPYFLHSYISICKGHGGKSFPEKNLNNCP